MFDEDILQFIGSMVLSIVLLAIPVLCAAALAHGWHPFLTLVLIALTVVDVVLMANLISYEAE